MYDVFSLSVIYIFELMFNRASKITIEDFLVSDNGARSDFAAFLRGRAG
jgi:hypothetical protein